MINNNELSHLSFRPKNQILKMSEAPRTPIRHLKPGGDEENLRRTPGGVSMDIVLTPALKAPPTK